MGRRSVLVCTWRDRWHPEAGGAELYLHRVIAVLAADGWDVTVATATYDGAAATEVRDGIRYVRRGGTFGVYAAVALAYLRGEFGRPDVVLDVQNGVSFLATVWARRPVVVLHHHAHQEQWRALFGPVLGRLGWFIESQVAPRLQRRAEYVTVSDASRQDLVAHGVDPARVVVAPNGVDPPATPAPLAPTHGPRLVVLGRLVPHKRVELAIDTLAELRRSGHRTVGLDVVGDGAWRRELQHHAASRGVADAVEFHGHVEEEHKSSLLARARVLLLPSVKEGWGLVVTEAGLLGTPTVAFADAGGVRESVLDGRTGLLATDPSHFVECVRSLLDDDEQCERLGAAARAHARSFTWDVAAAGVAGALQRARGRGRRRSRRTAQT